MSGLLKKVRFSKTNIVHLPETPELTQASFSPASSAGPITPPDAYVGLPGPTPYSLSVSYDGYSQSMYAPVQPKYAPQPSLPPPPPPPPAHTRQQLHPLLEYSRTPAILFDMLDPPSMASRARYPLPASTMAEAATNPPASSLTIECPQIFWEIIVVAQSNRSYVTVGDVLEQLYSTLRTGISKDDYLSLGSKAQKQKAQAAYEHRYRRYRSRTAYEQEKAGGMKRIDFLMGNTRFMGLSKSKSKRRNVLALNTG